MWGTAFLRAGVTRRGPDLTRRARDRDASGGDRGHHGQRGASLGDKTLLDALSPATDSLEASFKDPSTAQDHGVAALQQAADVAVKAAEDTKGMLALRGRAAYTGERSRDSVDAGATAIGVILQAVAGGLGGEVRPGIMGIAS